MKNKSTNLAVVSNKTFEATKVVNLNHYDISSALQTTLDFNKLIQNFSSKVASMVPHSAYVYTNKEFGLEIKNGVFSRHSCSYALKVEDQTLGELKLMRSHKFDIADLELLETLLCCLIYPLKNATLYQQALRMAYTDPLTQTSNRSAFDDYIKREISLATRHSKSLSIIFLDVDHFKHINDQYGHECGDVALTSVAKWIKECLRSSDAVFRFGGEEFVVILSETDLIGAELVAERIRNNIENHTMSYNMQAVNITASLGVSELRGNETVDALVKRADGAMYKAKKNGRNQVVLAF
ncbi:diguanylate cyclase [Methyloglobulus morosus KoM1]|uniref:diguanylate cyclase n=1 Tax=Methyloglobulus morosus KoM1 TaxID=1116472 RepID=V5C9C0_9GAMM|nr:GGDEF domain-containing protein [Methyloglobulus morosus]ESS73383.1 diguanylate cyclase [Methyloglobulus morosus KoM1]